MIENYFDRSRALFVKRREKGLRITLERIAMRDQAIYIKAIASEKIQIKLDAVGALTVEGLQAIRIGPEQRELFDRARRHRWMDDEHVRRRGEERDRGEICG